MKKPELLVTPLSLAHIKEVCEAGATAILIGEQRYGLRLAGEITRNQLKEAVSCAHSYNVRVYVAVNGIFHNDKVDELNDYLIECEQAGVDGVVFGDPAVLMAARESTPDLPLHWNTETTATNYFTCNYWGKKGAGRAVLARELSMDAVIEMKENAEVEIEVQVHGMSCMFQSKRSLLGNYFLYQGKAMEIENRHDDRKRLLHDKERNNKYPIFEDENGTHIMSPNDMCLIDELTELMEAGVDSLKIDGVLQSASYVTRVTELYRTAIDLCADNPEAYEEQKDSWLKEIGSLQQPHRPIDTGFFFKETVY